MKHTSRFDSPAKMYAVLWVAVFGFSACGSTARHTSNIPPGCEVRDISVNTERAEVSCAPVASSALEDKHWLRKYLASGRKIYLSAEVLPDRAHALEFLDNALGQLSAGDSKIEQDGGQYIRGTEAVNDATELNVAFEDNQMKALFSNASYTVIAIEDSGAISFQYVVH